VNGYAIAVVALSAAYLATFVPATRAARRGDPAGRLLGYAVGAVGIVLAAVLNLVALLLFGLRCDESCNENLVPSARTPGWMHTIHAWQWDAQLGVALAALVLGLAAVVLLRLRRESVAAAAAVVAAVLVTVWAVVVVPVT